MFLFQCQNCKTELEAQDEWEGMNTQCPHCQAEVTIKKDAPPPQVNTAPEPAVLTPVSLPAQSQAYSDNKALYIVPAIVGGAVLGYLIGMSFGRLIFSSFWIFHTCSILGLIAGVITGKHCGLYVYRLGKANWCMIPTSIAGALTGYVIIDSLAMVVYPNSTIIIMFTLVSVIGGAIGGYFSSLSAIQKLSMEERRKADEPMFTPRKEIAHKEKFFCLCAECGQMLEFEEEQKGQQVECRFCQEQIIATPTEEKPCPNCGELIKLKATFCKHCKKQLNTTANYSTMQPVGQMQPMQSVGQMQPVQAGNVLNSAVAYNEQRINDRFMLLQGEAMICKASGVFRAGFLNRKWSYFRLTNSRIVIAKASWLYIWFFPFATLALAFFGFYFITPSRIFKQIKKDDIISFDSCKTELGHYVLTIQTAADVAKIDTKKEFIDAAVQWMNS